MKNLLLFELRKAWKQRWFLLPAVLAAVLILYSIVSVNLVEKAFDGTVRKVNQEFQPYLGQTMTEELLETAREKALALGAEEVIEDFGNGEVYRYFMYDGVRAKYGAGSFEEAACINWSNLYSQPLLEEEKAGYVPKSPEEREKGASTWRVPPAYSAWRFFLPFDSFEAVLTGFAVVALILIVTSAVFTQQEAGGLQEVCLATVRSKVWIGAKILTACISGIGIAWFLYLGLFLYQGLLFGFQGAGIGALSLVAGGYCYGLLVHEATVLELVLLKFMVIGICGGFFGLLTAAISVLFRNAWAAAGTVAALGAVMQIPLYILPSLEYKLMFHPSYRKIPWEEIRTVAITPIRVFVNSEYLTRMWYMESQMDNTNFYNMMLDGQTLALFLVPIFAVMLLCVWACFGYKRYR